jgi:hypothetical protein
MLKFRPFLLTLALALCRMSALAQRPQAPPPIQQPAPPATQQSASQQAPPSDAKVRIYVSDSQSWEVTGGWGASNGSGGGATTGGARPQTAEIIKTFNQRCPEYVVTNSYEQ